MSHLPKLASFTVFTLLSCTSIKYNSSQNSKGINTRQIASDDLLAPVDIKNSPFNTIKDIDYKSIAPALNKYISSLPIKTQFHNQEQRWIWANQNAEHNKQFFSILPIKGEISNQALLKNPVFIKNIKEKNSDYSGIKWQMQKSTFATTPAAKLFSFEIFNQTSANKPSVLIWAKEHGDELGTSEFAIQLSEFLLFHLQGKGESSINTIVQNLLSKINIIVVPDMTPNKNLETFENGTSTMEDFNGYGIFLQPFNYDSNDPKDYILAPEAAYLKKIILGLDNLILGIDLHNPYGIGVIAGPDESVINKNKYLIAEASQAKCISNLNQIKPDDQCKIGIFNVSHPQISTATENSASYFSRLKMAPSILLELTKGTPEQIDNEDLNCKMRHKEPFCSYYIKPHLQESLPYVLRLLDIVANDYKKKTIADDENHFKFLQGMNAKSAIQNDDTFFKKLTPLDIKLRVPTSAKMTVDQFRNFVAKQTLNWQPEEIQRIQKSMDWIYDRLAQLKINLNLPSVTFIKTTGKEEANLPYTRRLNIILPQDVLYSKDLLYTLSHELFHIYTYTHPENQKKLYSMMGFDIVNKLSFANLPEKGKILTNPDVTQERVSIQVQYQNRLIQVIPIILSKIDINSITPTTDFTQNVDFKLWQIPDQNEDTQKTLINYSETNYLQAFGNNSDNIFHPEEILAENFALLLTTEMQKINNQTPVLSLLNFLQKK